GCPLRDLACGEHRIVSADGGQVTDIQSVKARDDPIQILCFFGWISSRSIEDRAALKMNSRNLVVIQFLDVSGLSFHQPLKAVMMPITLCARLRASRVKALMTPLMPGAGPPPTNMPIFSFRVLFKSAASAISLNSLNGSCNITPNFLRTVKTFGPVD